MDEQSTLKWLAELARGESFVSSFGLGSEAGSSVAADDDHADRSEFIFDEEGRISTFRPASQKRLGSSENLFLIEEVATIEDHGEASTEKSSDADKPTGSDQIRYSSIGSRPASQKRLGSGENLFLIEEDTAVEDDGEASSENNSERAIHDERTSPDETGHPSSSHPASQKRLGSSDLFLIEEGDGVEDDGEASSQSGSERSMRDEQTSVHEVRNSSDWTRNDLVLDDDADPVQLSAKEDEGGSRASETEIALPEPPVSPQVDHGEVSVKESRPSIPRAEFSSSDSSVEADSADATEGEDGARLKNEAAAGGDAGTQTATAHLEDGQSRRSSASHSQHQDSDGDSSSSSSEPERPSTPPSEVGSVRSRREDIACDFDEDDEVFSRPSLSKANTASTLTSPRSEHDADEEDHAPSRRSSLHVRPPLTKSDTASTEELVSPRSTTEDVPPLAKAMQRRPSIRRPSLTWRPSTAEPQRKKSVIFGIEEFPSVKWEDDDEQEDVGAQRPWTAGASPLDELRSPMVVRRPSVLNPQWIVPPPSTKLTRTVHAIVRESQGLPPRVDPPPLPQSQTRPKTAAPTRASKSVQAQYERPRSAYSLVRTASTPTPFSFSRPWDCRPVSAAPKPSSRAGSAPRRRPASAAVKHEWHRWSHQRVPSAPQPDTGGPRRSKSPDLGRSPLELGSTSTTRTFSRSDSMPSSAFSTPSKNCSSLGGGLSPLTLRSNSPRASLRASARLSSHGPASFKSSASVFDSQARTAFKHNAGKLNQLVGEYAHEDMKIPIQSEVTGHILAQDSPMLFNVLNASRQILIAAADTQGDFSWSVPDPRTYDELPKLLVYQRDWTSFKAVMCDLRFLWRKTKENGPSSILDTYQGAWLSMRATGKLSQRLVDYRDFFTQRQRSLQASPSSLFSLAFAAKQSKVREDCEGIVNHLTEELTKWSQTLLHHHLKAMDNPPSRGAHFARVGSEASGGVMSVGGHWYQSMGSGQDLGMHTPLSAAMHSPLWTAGRRVSIVGGNESQHEGRTRRMSTASIYNSRGSNEAGHEGFARRMSTASAFNSRLADRESAAEGEDKRGGHMLARRQSAYSSIGVPSVTSMARRTSIATGGVRRQDRDAEHGEGGRRLGVTVEEVLKLVKGKTKLQSLQEYGITACLSEDQVDLFAQVMDGLMERVHSSRAKLRESGMAAYEEQNRRVLGLTSLSRWHALEQPNEFLELVNLWGSEDAEDFLTVLAFLPPHCDSEEKKETFQVNLCTHIAEAAQVPKELVDVVSMETEEAQTLKYGVQCKVLMRFMEHVQALDVTVVRGYEWPVLDPMAKPDPIVTLVLRPMGSGRAARREGDSVMARNMQHALQQTKPKGENYANSETPPFDESFQFLIFDTEQELVVTCYEQDIGARAPIGEIVVPVNEILSQCHVFEDETYFKCFNLHKPATKKQAIFKAPMHLGGADLHPALELRFHFFTLQSSNNTTPTQMIVNTMPELKDDSSSLRLSSSIIGPAFHDHDGSFDSVRVYVSSCYGEMHNERAFLFRYVFPALRIRCLELRVHLRWSDLSAYGAGAVRDDVIQRLDTMKSCVLRDSDASGQEFHNVLAVVLLGERTGRLLDARDRRLLEKEDRLRGGELEWVVNRANGGSLSVQEMEVMRIGQNKGGLDDSVICLRDAAFKKSQQFVDGVPQRLREVFDEKDEDGKAEVRRLRRQLLEKKGTKGVVRYCPTFESYMPSKHEGNPEATVGGPDREAKDVVFGGLQQFGLEVFENLWRVLRQRFPSSRGRAMVNQYLVLKNAQEEAVRQYVAPLIMVPGGSQEHTLHALSQAASFTEECHPYTVFYGGAGSGRSSLLARLLVDQGAASAPTPTRADQDEWTVGKKFAGVRGAVLAMVGAKKWRRQSLTPQDDVLGRTPSVSRAPTAEDDPAPVHAQPSEEQQGEKRPKIAEDGGEEEELWRKAKEQMEKLQGRGYSQAYVGFLLTPPRIAYFFKDHFHSTSDVISYLCSALLRRQDLHAPSWTRLQAVVRAVVDPVKPSDPDAPAPKAYPLLLVLDGLDTEEREAIRSLVFTFHGRVRAIVSTCRAGQAASDFTIRDASRLERGDVVLCNPLTMRESEVVLTRLFDRVGAKKKPAYVYDITMRRAASCPLYLVMLTGYVKSCILMGQKPAPLRSIKNDAADIFGDDLLPVAENKFGVDLVQLFLEIVCQERRGRSKKEVQDILFYSRKAISGGKLELLMAAFRPFSDTVRSQSQESLSLNRPCIREAIARRYKGADKAEEAVPAENQEQLATLRREADEQERRIGKKRDQSQALALGASHQDGGAEWLSDSEDSANPEDKDDEDSEAGERQKRLEAGEVDELVIHFGQRELRCNQQLFDNYCGVGDMTGYIRSSRTLTMDMNEASRLLDDKGIVPTFLPKSEVAKVFRLVNLDRKLLGHANSDIHELNFHEFLVFMSRLEESYTDRIMTKMEQAANRAKQTPVDLAAVLIQKRAKGMAARRRVKEMKLQKELKDLQSKATNSPAEMKRIITIQALLRKRQVEARAQEHKLLKASTAAKEREDLGHPDVKGHIVRDGSIARAQARLMEVFDTVEEAFVFVDTDGNGQITKVEFQRGFWRLGMRDEGTIKLGMMLAVGGSISALVFLRRFAWHDVRSVEKSLAASQLKRASVMRKVRERLEREKRGLRARSDEDILARSFGVASSDANHGVVSRAASTEAAKRTRGRRFSMAAIPQHSGLQGQPPARGKAAGGGAGGGFNRGRRMSLEGMPSTSRRSSVASLADGPDSRRSSLTSRRSSVASIEGLEGLQRPRPRRNSVEVGGLLQRDTPLLDPAPAAPMVTRHRRRSLESCSLEGGPGGGLALGRTSSAGTAGSDVSESRREGERAVPYRERRGSLDADRRNSIASGVECSSSLNSAQATRDPVVTQRSLQADARILSREPSVEARSRRSSLSSNASGDGTEFGRMAVQQPAVHPGSSTSNVEPGNVLPGAGTSEGWSSKTASAFATHGFGRTSSNAGGNLSSLTQGFGRTSSNAGGNLSSLTQGFGRTASNAGGNLSSFSRPSSAFTSLARSPSVVRLDPKQAASAERLSSGNNMLLLARMPSTASVSSVGSTTSNSGLREWMGRRRSSAGGESDNLSSSSSSKLGSLRGQSQLESLRAVKKKQRSPPLRSFGATQLSPMSLVEESSPKSAASNPLTDGSGVSVMGTRRVAKKRGTLNAPPQLVNMTSKRMLTTLTSSVSTKGPSISECFADRSPMQATPKALANTKFMSKKRMLDWISSGKLSPTTPKAGQSPLTKGSSSRLDVQSPL